MDRWVVPIPKQMTNTFFGGRLRNARGRWAIIFVIGVRPVIPIPFTRSCFSILVDPMAVTVAVLSRRTSRGVNWLSKLLVAKTRTSDTRLASTGFMEKREGEKRKGEKRE